MARFCFYCGRALADGEKCNCRSDGRAERTASQTAGQPSGGRSSGSPAGAKAGAAGGSTQSGNSATASRPRPAVSTFAEKARVFFQSVNPFAASGKSRAGNDQRRNARRTSLSWAGIRQTLRHLAQYLLRPAESARLAAQETERQPVLLVLTIQAMAGGFFLLAAARQSVMQALLSLNIASVQESVGFINGLFIFVQGFGVSLASSLLIVLLYHLALRYLFRQQTSFRQLLAALSPAFLYAAVFLLAALFALAASIFNAVMLLFVGFAIGAVLHFLALRKVAGLEEDRILTLVIFVLVLFTGIMAILLNLSLPVLRILVDQSVTI
jgi:hypothetical protein